MLCGFSFIAAIGDIATLPSAREDLACCAEIPHGACAAAILGVVQIGVQFTCFMALGGAVSLLLSTCASSWRCGGDGDTRSGKDGLDREKRTEQAACLLRASTIGRRLSRCSAAILPPPPPPPTHHYGLSLRVAGALVVNAHYARHIPRRRHLGVLSPAAHPHLPAALLDRPLALVDTARWTQFYCSSRASGVASIAALALRISISGGKETHRYYPKNGE